MLVAHRGPLVGHIGPRVYVTTRIVIHFLLLVYDKAHLCRLISNLSYILKRLCLSFYPWKVRLKDLQHKRQSILPNLIHECRIPTTTLPPVGSTIFVQDLLMVSTNG